MVCDAEEFTLFFNQVYPNLCRFLECFLGGIRVAAQDIAQESFLRLYRTSLNGMSWTEARFWVFRVARNLALNELNKQQTRNRLSPRFLEVFRSRAPDPEAQYEQAERAQVVLDLLRSLPEDQRAALLLREQQGMSYREIAAVLNVSESKVKVDIFRARKSLRDQWQKLGEQKPRVSEKS